MADLTVAVFFTDAVAHDPAVGLALGDIDLYLTEQDRATGADVVIWNGAENPTEELDNIGAYSRIYPDADWDANHYYAYGEYTGAVILDTDHVTGATDCCSTPVGTAIEFTYTVYEAGGPPNIPIPGVRVTISTDIAGTNTIWGGDTDVFGVARDDYGQLPRLDPGTYYFWRSRTGYTFTNPDQELVA